MRAPERFYRFEPGNRVPFDPRATDRTAWFPYARPQTYTRWGDAEHRLKACLASGWYPDARLYVSNDVEWSRLYPEVSTGGDITS